MDMESRVSGLERTVRRQRFAGLAVLLVIGSALLLGQTKQPRYVGIAASIVSDGRGGEKRVLYRLSADGTIEEVELFAHSLERFYAKWKRVDLEHRGSRDFNKSR